MTEVGNDDNYGRKRRLPVWMLVVGAGENKEENRKCKQSPSPKSKRIKSKEHTLSVNNVVKTETRKRTRKLKKNEGICSTFCGTSNKANFQKKEPVKNSGDENKPVRRKTVLKLCNLSNGVPQTIVSADGKKDKIELTVEDLISIAQEYVTADGEKKRLEMASRQFKSEDLHSSLSTTSKNMSKSSSEAGSRIISKCSTTSSHSYLTEIVGHGNEKPEQETVPTDITRTGDAAQDMLDLFLGPLLKKADTRDRKYDISTTKNVIFASESSTHTRGEASWKLVAPLEKKKSSLKDKVAMFLD